MNQKSSSMNIADIVLVLAAISTGLVAGLFYAYSCSVNPGLGALGDKEYLAAMQSINLAIQNPVFFATFMGTVLLLPLATWLHYTPSPSSQFWLLVAASVIYIVGTFGVTVVGNVPLNNELAVANLDNTRDILIKYRGAFETPWNMWHSIRTIANVVAFALVVTACIKKS